MKKLSSLLCSLGLLFSLSGCGDETAVSDVIVTLPEAKPDSVVTVLPEVEETEPVIQEEIVDSTEDTDVTTETTDSTEDADISQKTTEAPDEPVETTPTEQTPDDTTQSDTELAYVPTEGEYYYDPENVVLYLEYYGELPDNYITKNEARDLGWSGGSVERYLDGAAIGGDTFGNREGVLPKADGRRYTECDLYTDGENSRGAYRLVFSNDGLYFYTEDHYETFTELWVEDGEVVWG